VCSVHRHREPALQVPGGGDAAATTHLASARRMRSMRSPRAAAGGATGDRWIEKMRLRWREAWWWPANRIIGSDEAGGRMRPIGNRSRGRRAMEKRCQAGSRGVANTHFVAYRARPASDHNRTVDIASWSDRTAGRLTDDVDISPAQGMNPAFVC
jgi:hypothetical protein